MPQFDPGVFATQIFWLALTFIPLYFILSRSLLPKIGGILEQRQRRLDDDLGKAEALRKEAETVLAEYEKAHAEAEARAQAAVREAQEAIAAETAKAQDALSETLAKQLAEAEARIAQARQDAASGIREAAAEVASAATERLIGVKPDAKTAAGAVDTAAGD